MNKQGFLLAEETLKIVIAVICLAFLAYFLTSLYFKNQESKELELAKASLEHLIDEINAKTPQVEIYNPKGWVISSWSKGNMPNSCSNLGWNDCICICNEDTDTRRINGLKKDCDESGICLEISKSISIEGERNWYKKDLVNSIVIKPLPKKLIINGDNIK